MIAFLLIGLFGLVQAQYSGTWNITNAPQTGWMFIASDSSGQYLTAADSYVYISSDYGYNWSRARGVPSSVWYGLASSASGQFRALSGFLDNSGSIHFSSNYGLDWTVSSSAGNKLWYSIACSADFQYLAATLDGATIGIYYSNNNGTSWSAATGVPADSRVISIASSTSGENMAAVVQYGSIYTSTDHGESWGESSSGSNDWYAIASDSTGSILVAAIYSSDSSGGISVSTDGGTSWSLPSSIPTKFGYVAVSSDYSGQCLAAAANTGGIYLSVDTGSTWNLASSAPQNGWYAIASDSTGQYLTAGQSNGGIYILLYSPSSQPSSTPTLQPFAFPTNDPTCQPSMQPSTQPFASPTMNPISLPSQQPSSSPSSWPSDKPSAQPSSFPTLTANKFNETFTVKAQTTNVTHIFTNIGLLTPVFLTAFLDVSNDDLDSGAYVSIIIVGRDNVSSVYVPPCAPSENCGSMSCTSNMDVTSLISPSNGGSLTLYATTVNEKDANGQTGLCSYQMQNNLYFAITYTISGYYLPTASPTTAPSIVNEATDDPFSSQGAPFYIIAAFSILYVALGIVLVRLRDKHSKLSQFKLQAICLDLGMIGYHFISEVWYLIFLFDEGSLLFADLACVIIATRLLSLLVTVYFALIIAKVHEDKYSTLLDHQHMSQYASVYSLVFVAMIFEHTTFKYLPWKTSQFVIDTAGYPYRECYTICMNVKLIQLMITMCVQIAVLSHNHSEVFYKDSNDLAFVLIYLTSSIITLLLFGFSYFIRVNTGGTAYNVDQSFQGPMHRDTELTQTTNLDLSVTIRDLERRMSSLESNLNSKFADMKSAAEEREALLNDTLQKFELKLQELHNNEFVDGNADISV